MPLSQFIVMHPRLRRFVTKLLVNGDDQFIGMLGGKLLINPRKEHGYWRAEKISRYCNAFRYEAAGIVNLAMLLDDGDTFVDVGANVGMFSITLSRINRLSRHVRFYAYEAVPDTFSRLQMGARGLPIEVRQIALSDKAGTLMFVSGGVSNAFTTEENASAWNIRDERQTIRCERLDAQVLIGDRIVLKVDVEGQERQVLDGAEGLFSAGRIKAVYLDGFKDKGIRGELLERDFELFNGWTLEPALPSDFCLLAVRRSTPGGLCDS